MNELYDFVLSRFADRNTEQREAIITRLKDLLNRQIKPEHATAYLRSAGWADFYADVYKEFLAYRQEHKEEQKQEKNMDTITFTEDQVQELMLTLLEEIAKSAGFREPRDGEVAKSYRKELTAHLESLGKKDPVRELDGGLGLGYSDTAVILRQLADIKELYGEAIEKLSVAKGITDVVADYFKGVAGASTQR